MNKNILLIVLLALIVVLGLAGCSSGKEQTTNPELEQSTSSITAKNKIIVYKSQYCGCCSGYISYLKQQGFDVESVEASEDLSSIKSKYGIPDAMESCHTSVIGDYFIEGHVPVEAINKLLNEKPTVNGIALPGMPPGAPGMPGQMLGNIQIYSVTNRVVSEFDY